jgi:hypothetical protein
MHHATASTTINANDTSAGPTVTIQRKTAVATMIPDTARPRDNDDAQAAAALVIRLTAEGA